MDTVGKSPREQIAEYLYAAMHMGISFKATDQEGITLEMAAHILTLIPDKKRAKKLDNETTASTIGEKVKDVFGRLDKLRGYRQGYRPPKRKAEAASIIRMLKVYTPDEIIEVWQTLKSDKFWQVKELFMMTVESQIGAILKNGTYQSKPGKIPTRYTRPEELLQ